MTHQWESTWIVLKHQLTLVEAGRGHMGARVRKLLKMALISPLSNIWSSKFVNSWLLPINLPWWCAIYEKMPLEWPRSKNEFYSIWLPNCPIPKFKLAYDKLWVHRDLFWKFQFSNSKNGQMRGKTNLEHRKFYMAKKNVSICLYSNLFVTCNR